MTVRADHTALKGPCIHNRYEGHPIIGKERPTDVIPSDLGWCPGGTVLRPDTIANLIWQADYGQERKPDADASAEEEFHTHHLPLARRILDALAAARTGEGT